MFGFLNGHFGGFQTVRDMANYLGIDYKIYATALTDQKVNFATLKRQRNFSLESGVSDIQTLELLIRMTAHDALAGLYIMEKKYGFQSGLQSTVAKLEMYINGSNSNGEL